MVLKLISLRILKLKHANIWILDFFSLCVSFLKKIYVDWGRLSTNTINNDFFHTDGRWTCVVSPFSRVLLFATLQDVAHWAPLSMGSSRQEYWSGLPCSPPGDLPDPGMEPTSSESPALAGGFREACGWWEGGSIPSPLKLGWPCGSDIPGLLSWGFKQPGSFCCPETLNHPCKSDCSPERKVPSAPGLFQLQCLKGPAPKWGFHDLFSLSAASRL